MRRPAADRRPLGRSAELRPLRGRKPKPLALRVIEGNPGKRPINHDAPPAPPGLPPAPPELTADALTEWERCGAELVRLGVMTGLDLAVFASYCQAWARWREAEGKLAAGGGPLVLSPRGLPAPSPWLLVSERAQAQMLKAAIELGLTPSSRSRIKVDGAEKRDPDAAFFPA